MDGSSTQNPSPSATARTGSPPRLFFVGMALLMMGIVAVGFWPTYFGPLLSGTAPGHPQGQVEAAWVLHGHAAVFLGWMGLLLAQTVLVSRGRTPLHMRLGQYGAALGLLVFLMGGFITAVQLVNFASASTTWEDILLVAWPSLETISQFAVLLALGWIYRTRPEAHKRYMLFATAALLYAATDRMGYLLGPWCAEIMFPVTVGPIFAYDLYAEGRLQPATLIGTAVLLPHFAFRALLN